MTAASCKPRTQKKWVLQDELLLSPFQQQLSPQSEDSILNPMHSAFPETFEQCLAQHSVLVFYVPGSSRKGGSNSTAQVRQGEHLLSWSPETMGNPLLT